MTRNQNNVVRAYTGPAVLVEMYHAELSKAGIECRVVGSELVGSIGSVLPESVELWVHQEDLPKAKDVIKGESRRESRKSHDRPHHQFPHPSDDPKPTPPPYRREPYVNPDPGT
jgi:hypothetical protein